MKRLVPILLLCTALTSCLKYRFKDKDISSGLARTGYEWKEVKYDTLGYFIRYIKIGRENLPKALILHGSPGTGKTFYRFTKDTSILNHFQIILVDRPGYGKSSRGRAVTSIKKQADLLNGVIHREFKDKGVGMATSYGGPVLAELAYQFPEKFKGIVLVSPSLAPGQEKIPWLIWWPRYKVINWTLPNIFVIATREKLNHKSALEEVEDHYTKICVPTTHIIGRQDKLIFTSNLQYAKEKFSQCPAYDTISVNGEHFLTFKYQGLIIEKMKRYLR